MSHDTRFPPPADARVAAAGSEPAGSEPAGSEPAGSEPAGSDAEQILRHVQAIFDAFLRHDRAAIRRLHSDDWRGFLTGSRRLLRGIDDYVAAADDVLASLRATRYEMLDVDVQVHGDVAVVYYLARDWLQDHDGRERTVLLRAVDVYRREAAGWNQCGSNICALTEP